MISRALIEIDDRIYNFIISKDLSKFSKDELEFLYQNNIIIDDELQEINLLKLFYRTGCYSNNLGLTIIPTLDCNFNCTYCYEYHKKINLDDRTTQSIKEFIKNNICNYNKFEINWFGGEPLLEIDKIIYIMDYINNLIIKNNVNIKNKFSMVTNGYLLNAKTSEIISSLGIKSIQITLDGPPEIHDKRRVLNNGKATFNQILKNIVDNTNFFDQIVIRINIDKQNELFITNLLEILKKAFNNNPPKNIILFPFFVSAVGASCNYGLCFSENKKSELYNQIIKEFYESGLNFETQNVLSLPDFIYCSYYLTNNFIIDPSGNILKCIRDLYDINNNKIGFIDIDGTMKLNYSKFINKFILEPFDDIECINCIYLPLCMGGCKASFPLKNCTFMKEAIKEKIISDYKKLKII